jgi:hypothetical protein
MAVLVSLKEVVEAIETQVDNSEAFLNPDTGEIVGVMEEERRLVEEGRSHDRTLPAWQQEILPKVREALESGRFLRLPDCFEVHEWNIMERFSDAQEDERIRGKLGRAIHGSGAFRRFKDAIRALGLEDDWYQLRTRAIEEIARDWLEAHHLPYK